MGWNVAVELAKKAPNSRFEQRLSNAVILKVDAMLTGASAPPTGGAEGGDGDGAEVLNACRKCGGAMKPGKAMGQTMDCSDEGTCSPAGPGKMVDCMKCMKCMKCGWSVSVGVSVARHQDNPPADAEGMSGEGR